MKKLKTEMVMTALCMAVMAVTGCGNESSSKVSDTESTTEWWEVSKEGMDEAETTICEEETTDTSVEEKSEETSETTEEATEETSESSEESDSSGDSGSSGTGSAETEDTTDLPEEVTVDILIDGEQNLMLAEPIIAVAINGYEDDSIKMGGSEYLDTFTKCAGLQMNDKLHYNPDGDSDNIFWYGQGYSSEGKEGCVYIEAVPVTEGTMTPTDIDSSQRENYYRVRSLYASAEDIGDLDVSFAFVKIGMDRATVEACYGRAGNESFGYTYYANTNGALLLLYNDDDIVEEMYLFVDYVDYLKIRYTAS